MDSPTIRKKQSRHFVHYFAERHLLVSMPDAQLLESLPQCFTCLCLQIFLQWVEACPRGRQTEQLVNMTWQRSLLGSIDRSRQRLEKFLTQRHPFGSQPPKTTQSQGSYR